MCIDRVTKRPFLINMISKEAHPIDLDDRVEEEKEALGFENTTSNLGEPSNYCFYPFVQRDLYIIE